MAIGVPAAFLGIAVVIGVVLFVPQHLTWIATPPVDTSQRLAFALRWLTIPGLTLLSGIVAASRRGFFADAVSGTRTPKNHALEINLRYNQNTFEQVLLATIAWLASVVQMPPHLLPLIPVFSILFAVGRISFWIGYLVHPMGRAFGMTLTVVPTIGLYVWLVRQTFQ